MLTRTTRFPVTWLRRAAQLMTRRRLSSAHSGHVEAHRVEHDRCFLTYARTTVTPEATQTIQFCFFGEWSTIAWRRLHLPSCWAVIQVPRSLVDGLCSCC